MTWNRLDLYGVKQGGEKKAAARQIYLFSMIHSTKNKADFLKRGKSALFLTWGMCHGDISSEISPAIKD